MEEKRCTISGCVACWPNKESGQSRNEGLRKTLRSFILFSVDLNLHELLKEGGTEPVRLAPHPPRTEHVTKKEVLYLFS